MQKIIEVNLSEKFESIELFPIGDSHFGSKLHDEVLFKDTIKMIKAEPNRFVIINGDIINNNITGAVGSTYEDTMSPKEQKKQIKHMLSEIKDRILICVGGNHEARTKKINDENPLEDIAEYLGVPYAEEDAFLKITVGKNKHNDRIAYLVYATHGNGGGKRPGSSLNNIESLTLNCYSEIYIMNHVHRKIAHKATYLMPDMKNNNVIEKEMLYVVSSSFQDYGGYAKKKMLRPSAKGAVPIYLSGREKYYHATV